jgi:hypothetical protein
MSALTGRRQLTFELDTFTPRRLKACECERHDIRAGAQVDDAELAGAVGDGAAHFLDQRVAGGLDRDTGQHAPDASRTTPVIVA